MRAEDMVLIDSLMELRPDKVAEYIMMNDREYFNDLLTYMEQVELADEIANKNIIAEFNLKD